MKNLKSGSLTAAQNSGRVDLQGRVCLFQLVENAVSQSQISGKGSAQYLKFAFILP